MSLIKTPKEQELMRKAGEILGIVLSELEKKVRPGITPKQLDEYAEHRILELQGIPAFRGYMGFPATLCTAVNAEVVHTIPTDRPLQEGDIISIDCGVKFKNYHSDSAITVGVGTISPTIQSFLNTAEQALIAGINSCLAGNFTNDISKAIQQTVESENYSIIRDLTGHGIGKKLHEDPHVPNFQEPRKGRQLQPGMTLAIEPIISMGSGEIYTAKDKWNILTKDHSLSAQVEHTILITEKEPEILTKRPKNILH